MRNINLIAVLEDEHPDVATPPEEAATTWTEEQIRSVGVWM